jgi:2-keto-3-deoxy-L-rhamnonate aldolase RhmA
MGAGRGVIATLDLSPDRELFGTFVYSPDPAVLEIVAAAGFDFAIVDTEHAPIGIADVPGLLRAAGELPVLVRASGAGDRDVGRMLDCGAAGVAFPHVRDGEEARRAATAVRYAPAGSRGVCSTGRATSYGLTPFADHAAKSDAAIVALGQVEDPSAVDDIDAILASGLDVVMPGPADLAAALGAPGRPDDPRVVAAIDRVVEAMRHHPRVTPGMYVSRPEEVAPWRERGVRMFVYSIDQKLLAAAYRDAAQALRASAQNEDLRSSSR